MRTLAKSALCGLYKYSGAMGLQEALGHRSIQNTRVYTKVAPVAVQRAVGKLSYDEEPAP